MSRASGQTLLAWQLLSQVLQPMVVHVYAGGERSRTQVSGPEQMADSDLEMEAGHWQCVSCTYANPLTTARCAMCETERGRQ